MTKKVFVSRDVVVDESAFWNWDMQQVKLKRISCDASTAASSFQNIAIGSIQRDLVDVDDPTLDSPRKLSH